MKKEIQNKVVETYQQKKWDLFSYLKNIYT